MIKLGKLKFKESNGPVGVEDPSKAKTGMKGQEKEAPRKVGSGKAVILKDEISIAKDKRGEASGSLTTERSKERLCKLSKQEEKKTL